jgi:phosphoribosyl 1,2-cyclic phosphodiesterase
MRVKFWGTRGSIPTPGRLTEKYGGNTACVEVSFEGHRIILDGGSGIRELGLVMETEGPSETGLMFSHLHWDHIQGIPFCTPFFTRGFAFHIITPPGQRERINKILDKQMGEDVFPVRFEDLAADISFDELPHEGLEYGPFHITAFPLVHPGGAFGIRIRAQDATMVYATDNELDRLNRPEDFDKLAQEVEGADLLIADAQYELAEIESKRGWGHSAYEDVLALARIAKVRRLAMIHHDPMSDDETLFGREHDIRKSHGDFNVFFARDSMAVTVRKP